MYCHPEPHVVQICFNAQNRSRGSQTSYTIAPTAAKAATSSPDRHRRGPRAPVDADPSRCVLALDDLHPQMGMQIVSRVGNGV